MRAATDDARRRGEQAILVDLDVAESGASVLQPARLHAREVAAVDAQEVGGPRGENPAGQAAAVRPCRLHGAGHEDDFTMVAEPIKLAVDFLLGALAAGVLVERLADHQGVGVRCWRARERDGAVTFRLPGCRLSPVARLLERRHEVRERRPFGRLSLELGLLALELGRQHVR